MAKLGETLKQERETRGVSLREISDATKIAVRYLEAIEQNHFDALPGGVFNKGFIRAYAAYVGLDEQRAVADYLSLIEPKNGAGSPAVSGAPASAAPEGSVTPNDSASPTAPRLGVEDATIRGPVAGIRFDLPNPYAQPDSGRGAPSTALLRVLWVVVTTIVLFGALLAWRHLTADADLPPRPDETAGPIAPATVPAPAPGDDDSTDERDTPPATVAGIGGGPSGPFNNGQAFQVNDAAAPASGMRHRPSEMNLEIKVYKKSWVRVVCDEHELVNRRLRTNEIQTMQCTERIRISVNNVSAIQLTINGNTCAAIGKPGSRVFGYVIRSDDHMVLCPEGNGSLNANP
jgi:cytoskeletal protein RodZ